MSDLLELLTARGFVQNFTPGLEERLREGPMTAYVGFDPTADSLHGINLMDFLRDTGKHFTLSFMLQKESVASRLETGITYTEFSYMLIQAYDFWHLFKTEGCELQMGGSDQWGNITAGTHLV